MSDVTKKHNTYGPNVGMMLMPATSGESSIESDDDEKERIPTNPTLQEVADMIIDQSLLKLGVAPYNYPSRKHGNILKPQSLLLYDIKDGINEQQLLEIVQPLKCNRNKVLKWRRVVYKGLMSLLVQFNNQTSAYSTYRFM